MIRFYDKAEPAETGGDGLATYRLETYFEAYRDITTRIVRRARPADIAAYPAQYAAYQAARVDADDGFPLVAWPGADEAVRLGLAERGIYTVERLAQADLAAAPVEYRDAQLKAAKFIDDIRMDAPRLAAEIAQLKSELTARDEDIAELRSEIARLKKPAKKPAKPAEGE
ncbi:hypothetical protein FPY71_11585 [Aureimonas fodinaquatilis]|uniref:Uncharacterized protein n=1 Tax=Aureimonas fodinaquatilis TaxID=2565783 RepID=A0A5B0DZV6_9HYPH|nr:hypothetical protein [Aureimonas fodinaquatilis]KAA0971080.1 hypothetical protein FPY71_11585 [Aureimonas fodinaquatilis]